MRTTVTLEADVAARLQELVHRTRRPFKAVLNETLRQGLGSAEKPKAVKPFRVKARAGQLRPGFDDRRFNQLADELEAEAVAAKLARRR
jgi:predicted transcriptional regulator